MAGYRKLLVLLDLSDDSNEIANAIHKLVRDPAASIVLLHVVEFVPVEPMGESLIPGVEIEDELMKRSGEKLQALVATLGLDGVKLRVEAGNTKAEILRVAEEEKPDLIVLGSHERHGLAILINLTEDTVLHAAHCDVLAVRLR
jgi:universal stress protein A